jgi:phage-related baseplate assembly protein
LKLPKEINFIEVDAEKINNELINNFEDAYGETLYPADERRIFLQQETQVLVALKNDINQSARENLLRYATGSKLEAIGEFYDTYKIEAQKAKVLCRITLSAIRNVNTIVPKGTRITPDGVLFFTLLEDVTIAAAQLTSDAYYEASEAGSKYNNFTPSQIKTIVDPIPYVTTIVNLETSNGGSDVEDDDRFRERIRLAPRSFSAAGPSGAYEYFAKSADSTIKDVKITSPSPGVVKLTILLENGGIPSQEVLDKVLAECSSKDRRPLTDNVQTAAPTVQNYDVNLTYYIAKERELEENAIKSALNDAISTFISWQQSALGRAINPDYLRMLLLNAGAFRIDITTPVYTAITEDKVAKTGTITANYGGLI